MICAGSANVLSGVGLICDLVRPCSPIDHTRIVDRSTEPCNEGSRLVKSPARRSGITNVGFREATLPMRFLVSGRNRRLSPLAVRPGEGRLTEPTPAVQPRSRELVFMPHKRP